MVFYGLQFAYVCVCAETKLYNPIKDCCVFWFAAKALAQLLHKQTHRTTHTVAGAIKAHLAFAGSS